MKRRRSSTERGRVLVTVHDMVWKRAIDVPHDLCFTRRVLHQAELSIALQGACAALPTGPAGPVSGGACIPPRLKV